MSLYTFCNSHHSESQGLNDVTLYDIGAWEHTPYIAPSSDGKNYSLELINDEGGTVIMEHKINKCAMDSIAYFCERFLKSYNSAQQKIED